MDSRSAPALQRYDAVLATPFADLGIGLRGEALAAIDFLPALGREQAPRNPAARRVVSQIRAYLHDPAWIFDLPLAPEGTAFQYRVWETLRSLPVGSTCTYAALAERVHSAARAVGGACRANPIPLVIPCHRVVARHGLGGYGGATNGGQLDIKRWLLDHERGAAPAIGAGEPL